MQNNNISFKAINIANTRTMGNNINLYKITPNDYKYLENLKTKINIEELLPKLSKKESYVYGSLVEQALKAACNPYMQSTLISSNNKPCGILVTSNHNNYQFVNYVATWPTEINKKVPHACKILFQNLYNEVLKSPEKQSIELMATRFGKAISKYIHLGFKMCGGDNYIENMKIKRLKIEEIANKLNKEFNINEINDKREINLFDEFIR